MWTTGEVLAEINLCRLKFLHRIIVRNTSCFCHLDSYADYIRVNPNVIIVC